MLRLVTAPALFHVKICGVTSAADAALVAAAGADAIGLNFYPPSPRALTLEKAREVAAAIPAGVARVGVFVNATPEEIHTRVDALQLDLVQLHGDETPEFLPLLREGLRVIKAFRVEGDGSPVDTFLKRANDLGRPLEAILLDAAKTGEYGGSGVLADWKLAAEMREIWPPLILAGGLTPVNVAVAIRRARPAAVDTASGVEKGKGIKDEVLVRQFVAKALLGFRAHDGIEEPQEGGDSADAQDLMLALRVREEALFRREQVVEELMASAQTERERLEAEALEIERRERELEKRERGPEDQSGEPT